MSFEYEYLFDYNIDDLMGEGNKVGEILKTRAMLAVDKSAQISGRRIFSAFNSRPFIWMRTPGISKAEVKLRDGIIWFHTPTTGVEETKGKSGSRFILHPETASTGFWLESPAILRSVNIVDAPNVDNTTEEFRIAAKIVHNVVHGPYNAMLEVLKGKTDKSVEIVNNDVTIEGKKICGTDEHMNATGTFQEMGVNYYYNDDFFKDILDNDEYHRKTKQGITGIKNEIPGYEKQEFMEEWHSTLKRLVDEVEEYL